MRCLGDERISDSRRGYFALGCCDRAYSGLMRCLVNWSTHEDRHCFSGDSVHRGCGVYGVVCRGWVCDAGWLMRRLGEIDDVREVAEMRPFFVVNDVTRGK